MARILFLHGFASSGSGNKSAALKVWFGEGEVLAPDLPVAPGQSMALLESLLATEAFDLLVGSSLGGYYADCLNGRHAIPSVLINPSTRPFETLAPYVGEQRRWPAGPTFLWEACYLRELRALYRQRPGAMERYLVLLQTGDEVLDYRLAMERYQGQQVMVEPGGNHRFENLHDYLPAIAAFRSSGA